MTFLTNFLKAKANDALNGLTQTAIQFDPATASAAQIATVSDALSAVNRRLAELQMNFESAKKKVVDDEAEIHRNIDAATLLSGQGKDDKAGPLLDNVEKTLNPKLIADKQDVADIEETIKQFEGRRNDLQTKLSTAKSRTDTAQRDLERAKLQAARAHDMEDQAKKDAGLLQSVNDLDVASNAMEQAAAKARIDADTAMRNAKSLGGMASGDRSTDPDVAAAFAAADGKGTAPTMSVADRLAAMKANQAA